MRQFHNETLIAQPREQGVCIGLVPYLCMSSTVVQIVGIAVVVAEGLFPQRTGAGQAGEEREPGKWSRGSLV